MPIPLRPSMALAQLFVLSIAFLQADIACANLDDSSLSVTIVPSKNTGGAINLDEPIELLIKNSSNSEIKAIDPRGPQADECRMAIEFTNLETKEVYLSKPTKVSSSKTRFTNVASKILAPGESLTVQVSLLGTGGMQGSMAKWSNIPEPNTGAKYRVVAKYQVRLKNEKDSTFWSGKIESDPIVTQVASETLVSPNAFFTKELPVFALRMIQSDRRWMERTDDLSQTPLHIAAGRGYADVVKWLVENGADVNAIAYNGFTPLHLTSDSEIVKTILKHSPNLDIRATDGTPLQRAIRNSAVARSKSEKEKWEGLANLYLEAGATYDIITAIHRNDLNRVKAVFDEQISDAIYSTHDRGYGGGVHVPQSPLRCAASQGRLEICEYLIAEQKMDVDQFEDGSGYPILKDALPYPEIVRLLIDSGANLDKKITFRGGRTGIWIIGDDATILHFAAEDGVPETIKILIDAGVDIFAKTRDAFRDQESDQTALDIAASFGKADNAAAIINHPRFDEADASLRQEILDRCLPLSAFPSWLAREADRPKLIKVLLGKGANPNARLDNGPTAIQIAARSIDWADQEDLDGRREVSHQKELIETLRSSGGELDLFSAVAIGDESAVAQILAKHPEQVNARAYDSLPALHTAVELDHRNIIELLLKAGADVDIKNESERTGYEGDTALHCASSWERIEIAKVLLANGANVNAVNSRGMVPLHSAASMENLSLMRLLITNGARIDMKDKDGESPLDSIQKRNRPLFEELEKLSREYSGK